MRGYFVVVLLVGVATANPTKRNVFSGVNKALRDPVRASSAVSGVSPQALVDGNPWSVFTPGSNECTHTLKEENPWMVIDLGASYRIYAIDLWTREKTTESEYNRLSITLPISDVIRQRDSNLQIRIGNDLDFTKNPVCKYLPGTVDQQESFRCQNNVVLCGRYVSIQRIRPGFVDNMHICELRTFSNAPDYICDGNLESQDMVTCTCSGDPHCRQFDFNQVVNFQGSCLYTMARDGCSNGVPNGDPTWEVVTNNDRNFPTETVTRVRTVFVFLYTYDLEIEMRVGRKVFVNGEEVRGSPMEYANGKVVITITPQNAYVRVVDGIRVSWNGATIVKVDMPTSYRGQSCGICGNYNGDNTDDWIIGDSDICMEKYDNLNPRAGQRTSNLGLFGTSWTYGLDIKEKACLEECPTVPPVEPVCDPVSQAQADEHCAPLKDTSSGFAECLSMMTAEEIAAVYDACIYDACQLGDFDTTVCEHAADLRKLCQDKYGVTPDYRTDSLCPMTCGDGMEYRSCGSPCLPTCSDKTGSSCGDEALCEEGCFCESGLIYNGKDACVPAQQCGCLVPELGVYINVGETYVTGDCSKTCSCNRAMSALTCTTKTCPANTVCGLEEGVRDCYCRPPFITSGSDCVEMVNPCPADEELQCWTCSGASNIEDCYTKGKMETCTQSDPICKSTTTTKLSTAKVIANEGGCASRSTCDPESVGAFKCTSNDRTSTCEICTYLREEIFGRPVFDCKEPTPPPPPPGPDRESCFLPKETGPCSEGQTRWYFNSKKCKCISFNYGGCDGNTNNFESKAACEAVCEEWEQPAECLLPNDVGPCNNFGIRYYYVPEVNACKKFNYGGCEGNANNFATKLDCRNQCKRC